MKVTWNPSEELLAKMRKINEMKESGMTYDQISSELKIDRTYTIALNTKYKQMKGGSIDAS